MMYIGFFGYYPMIRVYLERIKSKALRLISKLSLFNVSVVAMYAFLISLFGLSALGFEEESAWFFIVLLAVGNAIFLMYDKVIIIYVKLLCRKIVSKLRFK